MKTRILTAVLVLSTMSGCAGIVSGGADKVTISTGNAKGAEIFLDGEYLGNERVTTNINRGDTYEIMVTKEHCETAYEQTGERIDEIIFLNLFIDFGIISMPIDFLSGNAWKPDSKRYIVTPYCPSN